MYQKQMTLKKLKFFYKNIKQKLKEILASK
jgi:hypothetical protein